MIAAMKSGHLGLNRKNLCCAWLAQLGYKKPPEVTYFPAHRNNPFLAVASFVYIRLSFADRQDWHASRASQAANHPSRPGRFQSVVRLERPAIEKKYWKEFSGHHRISLPAVAVHPSSI